MDTIYTDLITTQQNIIQAAIDNNYSGPALPALPITQVGVPFTKEQADDVIRTIRRTAPSKRASLLTSLPLFKVWFYRIIQNKFPMVPAVWEVFLTFGEVDYAQADATLVSQLDTFFQEGITSFFEPSTYQNIYVGYGLSLMAQINRDYTMLPNLDEIFLFKQLLKTAVDGNSQEKILEEAQIAGYYIPSMTDQIVRLVLSTQDSATFHRLMLVKNWNTSNKAMFDVHCLGSLIKDLRARTIANSNDPYPEVMYASSSKYKSKNKNNNYNNQNTNKKNNNKNNSKKKNKKNTYYKKRSNGNRSHSGSSDSKQNYYAEDFDSSSEEDYFIEVVDQNSFKDEEVFHVEERENKLKASFIVDTGATTHVINNKSLLQTMTEANVSVKSVHGKRQIDYIGTVQVGKLTLKNVLYIPSSTKNIG